MDDTRGPQVGEQLHRARQRPALGKQLAEELAVAALQRLGLGRREVAPDLARRSAREQAAAHPDAAVNAPAVDRHPLLGERPLPREDVGVHRVDERAVEVEDQRGATRIYSVRNETCSRRPASPERTIASHTSAAR